MTTHNVERVIRVDHRPKDRPTTWVLIEELQPGNQSSLVIYENYPSETMNVGDVISVTTEVYVWAKDATHHHRSLMSNYQVVEIDGWTACCRRITGREPVTAGKL